MHGIDYVINFELPKTTNGGIDEYVHRIGRTGRIGHVGKAISFYNERDEEIAPALVNILLECEAEIPDFLKHLVPEDGKAHFEDDAATQAEESGQDDNNNNDAPAWGAGGSSDEGEAAAPVWGGSGSSVEAENAAPAWNVDKHATVEDVSEKLGAVTF